jgi:3-hydroxyacyl-CoA dehydrogenase/3a,7a,12a-trihydroxy-5b-cholest-24-enoyl-CoA hydratase
MPKELSNALKPELVSPLVGYLCHESCQETGGLFEVGGGFVGKLRIERSEGKLFFAKGALLPEDIAGSWSDITSFDRSTHPADVAESFQPILANLQAK